MRTSLTTMAVLALAVMGPGPSWSQPAPPMPPTLPGSPPRAQAPSEARPQSPTDPKSSNPGRPDSMADQQARPQSAETAPTVIEAMTVKAAEAFAREIGLEQVETKRNDDKTTSVYGEVNGVEIELSLGECAAECGPSFEMYAYFGKQKVDSKFINSFNMEFDEKLILLGDGEVAMNLSVSLAGGVTMRHLVEVGKGFVADIDEALDYKPK